MVVTQCIFYVTECRRMVWLTKRTLAFYVSTANVELQLYKTLVGRDYQNILLSPGNRLRQCNKVKLHSAYTSRSMGQPEMWMLGGGRKIKLLKYLHEKKNMKQRWMGGWLRPPWPPGYVNERVATAYILCYPDLYYSEILV